MKANKAVAMEVGGAFSLAECYKLVRAYEETKIPFMCLSMLTMLQAGWRSQLFLRSPLQRAAQ